jgi:hypothetical protein
VSKGPDPTKKSPATNKRSIVQDLQEALLHVCVYVYNVCMYVCTYVCMYVCIFPQKHMENLHKILFLHLREAREGSPLVTPLIFFRCKRTLRNNFSSIFRLEGNGLKTRDIYMNIYTELLHFHQNDDDGCLRPKGAGPRPCRARTPGDNFEKPECMCCFLQPLSQHFQHSEPCLTVKHEGVLVVLLEMCALLAKLRFPALKTARSARDLTCNNLPRKKCAQACIDCCDEDAGESRVRSSNRQVIPCHLWNSANSSPPAEPASCSAHNASVRSVPHFPPNISTHSPARQAPSSHTVTLGFTVTAIFYCRTSRGGRGKGAIRRSLPVSTCFLSPRDGKMEPGLLWDFSSDEVRDRD